VRCVLNIGPGSNDPALVSLFQKAAITSRAELKTFVTNGTLPGGATITVAVFQRALLVLGGCYVKFAGETDADAGDVGA